jgi:hypothetical protein
MKKINIVWLFLSLMHSQLDAIVKVFVNNSSKTFLVRIYDSKNNITSISLAPGAIQDVFLPENSIDKIIIQDEKHSTRPLSAMTRYVLRKETSRICDNMIFIISQDATVKMFPAVTSRDEALLKIDAAYTKKAKLPTIDLTIHSTKTDQPWTSQSINYTIKHNKSFLESLESLFA